MNNESSPMESEPTLTKEEVLNMLRARGWEGDGVKEMVMVWRMQQEALRPEGHESEWDIRFEMDQADCYLALGDWEEAIWSLRDAGAHAFEMHLDELVEEIQQRIDRIIQQNNSGE